MSLYDLFKKELLDLVVMKYPNSIDGVIRTAMSYNLMPEDTAAKLVKIGDAEYKKKEVAELPPFYAKSCY